MFAERLYPAKRFGCTGPPGSGFAAKSFGRFKPEEPVPSAWQSEEQGLLRLATLVDEGFSRFFVRATSSF